MVNARRDGSAPLRQGIILLPSGQNISGDADYPVMMPEDDSVLADADTFDDALVI